MESTDYNDIKVDDVKYHQFKDEDLYLLFSRVSKNDADALHALTKFRKILVSESYSGTNGKNIEVDGVIYQTQSIDDAYLERINNLRNDGAQSERNADNFIIDIQNAV